jgi:hypothetical protein
MYPDFVEVTNEQHRTQAYGAELSFPSYLLDIFKQKEVSHMERCKYTKHAENTLHEGYDD